MIPHDAPDSHLPTELRRQIEEANVPHVLALQKRLNTPVPGNPHGGFPGLHHITEHKQTIRAVRTEFIEKWNAEHPDYEYVAPAPLEAPLTREEVETKIREFRTKKAAVHTDHAHAAHIEEALKEHPEEHHEALREFAKHELNTYGLKPQQYYFRRATALEAIKAKGKDPHNLMHRYEHHVEENSSKAESLDS
jgi:hypothetical protein